MSIQIVDKSRFAAVIIIVLALAGGLIFLGARPFRKESEKEAPLATPVVYEAMVQTKGQDQYESEEDQQTFLENGDVMAIFPEGHPWVETEKEEVIIKLKVTEEDAGKLMEGETKEIGERDRDLREGEGGEKEAGRETETVRLRKYKIDLTQIETNNLDKVYGEEIIKEKQL